VTAVANTAYTFVNWTEDGAEVATTAVYRFTATARRTLTANFTPKPQPLAVNDAAGVLEGEAVAVAVLANDIDPFGVGLAVIAVTPPGHGTATIDPGDTTVRYTAPAHFGGLDSFTYTLRDADGMTSTATVAIIVTVRTETNEAPQITVVDPAVQNTTTYTSSRVTVTAELPAGFYTATLAPQQVFFLSYTPVVTPTAPTATPPGILKFGNFEFDLAAFIDDVPQPGIRFSQPVVLTLHYDPALMWGINLATLQLYYWDGTQWITDGITLLSHDVAHATLTVSISHLSEFALFGAAAPTDLDPAPEPAVDAIRLYLPVVMGDGPCTLPSVLCVARPDNASRFTNDAPPALYLPAVCQE
jgi:uncharacterized repeat protein (TIGR02543 family)